jgi:hypothetical protein
LNRSIRSLAWFAIAAQVAFVACWLVAEALQRDYSGIDSGVSALAAEGARDPAITIVGFVVLGLGVAALAPGLSAVLPRRRAAAVAAGLFVLAGLSIIAIGLFRSECNLSQAACNARFDAGKLSWQSDVHVWAGLVMRVALILTPFALARALWPSPTGALALICAGLGGAISAVALILYGSGGSDGLVERVELLFVNLWVVIVAVGILHESRAAPELSRPAALRPRDFFGSAWSGEGTITGVPAVLMRPFGVQFSLSRETTWLSDEVALVRDRAVFPNGRLEERLRFARFVDPSHIHVSGDDMPDGADVTISDAGYQVAPYRLAVPIGPLRFLLTARDRAAVLDDGTLEYAVRVRWHGLPVARAEMQARPVDTEPASPQARAVQI